MKKIQVGVWWVLLLVLVGCAGIGAKPESFLDKLAATQVAITQVKATAADLVIEGKLSKTEGRKILDQTREASGMVSLARTLYGQGNLQSAQERLLLADRLVLQLREVVK